jgi:hypothetical protein
MLATVIGAKKRSNDLAEANISVGEHALRIEPTAVDARGQMRGGGQFRERNRYQSRRGACREWRYRRSAQSGYSSDPCTQRND